MKENLVVYYSRKGENYYNKEIIVLEKGNAQIAAEFIAEAVDADLFEIDTVKPYAENYRACCGEAMAEIKANARPEIKGYVEDISNYKNIYVCYPIWCGTAPMSVFTFLEHYDWTGKKVMPLSSNEGSGLANSVKDITEACKGATVVEGLSVTGHKTEESKEMIVEWALSNK